MFQNRKILFERKLTKGKVSYEEDGLNTKEGRCYIWSLGEKRNLSSVIKQIPGSHKKIPGLKSQCLNETAFIASVREPVLLPINSEEPTSNIQVQ